MRGATTISPLPLLYWCLLLAYLILWGYLSNQHATLFDDGTLYSMAYAHNAGANLFDGLVDNRPPLLMYLVAFAFRASPTIWAVRWLSIGVFGVLLVVLYRTLRLVSGRRDIAYCGVTLLVTNYSVRFYAVVEMSLSFWQVMMSLFVLITVFRALTLASESEDGFRHRSVLLMFAGVLWALAFYIKQQSVVVLPAVIALSIALSPPDRRLKEAAVALSIFSIGCLISVLLFYYLLLGNTPIAESYKYLVSANVARNAGIPWNSDWWSLKTSVLFSLAVVSLRIPLVAALWLECVSSGYRWLHALPQRSREYLVTKLSAPEASGRCDPVVKTRILALIVATLVWLTSAIGFYFLQVNAFTHYVLEVGVALALLLPLSLSAVRRYPPELIAVCNVLILCTVLLWHGLISDPVDGTLRDKVKADANVAAMIRSNSDKNDRILVLGDPVLYYLSDRLPASRFPAFVDVWTTSLMVDDYRAALQQSLARESTRLVVLEEPVLKKMPEEIRDLVVDTIKARYRALAVEGKDPLPYGKTIYIRDPGAQVRRPRGDLAG